MMVSMLAVVLDANAVHSDPWLAGAPGRKLLELAARGSCVVIYPDVVVEELRRQRRDAAKRAYLVAAEAVRDMAKAGIDVAQTAADLEASFDRIDADLAAAFEAVLERDNVLSGPVPDVTASKILKRDLSRRRPFIEVELKQRSVSVGFRDTLIWETILELLGSDRGVEKVLFVTADKGFLSDDSTSLHQDLLDDLEERGIDLDRIASARNLLHAIAEVEAAAQAALVTAATNALYELAGREISAQMVYGGDYEFPDFVQFNYPDLESAAITYIDQTTEFQFTDEGTGTVTATAEALVYIEGAVFKGDWFADEGETMQLLGELNNHYFEASSEIPVRVVVRLDSSGSHPEASSIVLEDVPAQTSESSASASAKE